MGAVFKTVCESVRARLRLVRLRHASANLIWDWGFWIADLLFAAVFFLRKTMTQTEMKNRTKQFALRVIRLVESLPETRTANVIGNQLLRSGTSVGAYYRAACRAKSTADFINKLAIVEEETDESNYWIELLIESNQVKKSLVENLLNEADEILSIVVSAIKTSKEKRNPKSEFPNPKSL
jgi:four helix bundle protein